MDSVVLDPKERENFEAFVRSGMEPTDPNFLARNHGGGYVMRTTQAAWAAWQYRAIEAVETRPLVVPFHPGQTGAANVLRQIQIKAARLLEFAAEGSPQWNLIADIHRMAASALQLKPTTPGDSAA